MGSYGMNGLSGSGTTLASPDSSLKPDMRYTEGTQNVVHSSDTCVLNFTLSISPRMACVLLFQPQCVIYQVLVSSNSGE